MKILINILILNAMLLNLWSQNYVYDAQGSKKAFTSEDIDIRFTTSTVKFTEKSAESFTGLIGILPAAVDIVFQITTQILEKRVKKFSSEYTKQKSFMEAGGRNVPNFDFVRTIVHENESVALSISFIAEAVPNLEAFVYYVSSIRLVNSSAKSVKRSNTFDYTIEIKPTLLVNKEKKVIELSPVTISSVKFGENVFPKLKHRTDIISKPDNAVLTEISIKIVESNPCKVRSEKILSVWNAHKESVKTIINNYLPKEKEETGEGESKTPNASTGSE